MKPVPVVLALSVAACTTLGAPPPTASTTNFPPATFDGKVDVGGHKLRMVTYGRGTPAVVIEAGGSQAGVREPHWKAVIDEISKTTRICVYDRANLGASDWMTNKWRTSQDIAKGFTTMYAPPPPPVARKDDGSLADFWYGCGWAVTPVNKGGQADYSHEGGMAGARERIGMMFAKGFLSNNGLCTAARKIWEFKHPCGPRYQSNAPVANP